MKPIATLAAAALLLATPALAQTTPSTAGGSASTPPSEASDEAVPESSGGTSGTVELPGGGTVTETRPAQEKRNGSDGSVAPSGETAPLNAPASSRNVVPPRAPH